jgi:hypothetical protein
MAQLACAQLQWAVVANQNAQWVAVVVWQVLAAHMLSVWILWLQVAQ